MGSRISEVHISKESIINNGELGISVMIGEITRQIKHETDEYIYKQFMSVNIDPNTIILHQKRILELENKNKELEEKIIRYEKMTEDISNLIYQERR